MRVKTWIWIVLAILCIGALCDTAIGWKDKGLYGKFEKQFKAGNLTKAEQVLERFSDTREGRKAALQLIDTYLSVKQPDRAIHVYEHITHNHAGRHSLLYGNSYEKAATKSLREYLIKHGDYERAWNYYPLNDSDENYYSNAECRLAYMVDVVNNLCLKGKHDEAMRFVNVQLGWFMAHVDSQTDVANNPHWESYTSENVRQKLYEQIQNVY